MKKTLLILIATTILTLVGCARQYQEETVRGVLYSDSTLTTTITDAELNFWELYYDDYPVYKSEGKYLGYAKTNREGKWAFSYIKHFDNPYMTERKFKRIYPHFAVEYDGKLIYVDEYNSASLMELYPGCWENPFDIDTLTSTADSTSTKKGGLQ